MWDYDESRSFGETETSGGPFAPLIWSDPSPFAARVSPGMMEIVPDSFGDKFPLGYGAAGSFVLRLDS